MEKRVREKTWVVLGKRDARTVDAIRAALVERDAGNLAIISAYLQGRPNKVDRETYWTPTPPL
jgi:hypothetical protein